MASTKNGASMCACLPRTVTRSASCIASSSAACVFGGVRLISSASSTCANSGPGTKVQRRRPVVGSSSMMSVPVTSVGIRSGVNWMRLNDRPSASASVRTSSVFAVPGMPVMRQWPPTSIVSSRCSTTSSCPTMILRTWPRIASSTVRNCVTSSRASSPRIARIGRSRTCRSWRGLSRQFE